MEILDQIEEQIKRIDNLMQDNTKIMLSQMELINKNLEILNKLNK